MTPDDPAVAKSLGMPDLTVFRRVVDAAPDATIIVDGDGTIVFASRRVEELFGWDEDDLVGSPMDILLPERFRERHSEHRERFSENPRSRPMGAGLELFGLRRDGTEFSVEISLSPIEVEGEVFGIAAVRDATERHRTEQELSRLLGEASRAETRFRKVVESAPDATLIADSDGRIILSNRQVESVFGYAAEDLVGRPIEVLLPERFRVGHIGHRTRFADQPQTRPMGQGLDLWGMRRDGTEFPVEISLSPIDTTEGTQIIAAVRDVSERQRVEQMKDEFLDVAAHELRTPLAAILGFAELVAEGWETRDDEDRRRMVGRIWANAEDANNLVNRLLDFSRLRAGRVAVEPEPIVLAEAVAESAEGVGDLHRDHNVVIDIPDDLTVRTDPSAFSHVLSNLLNNAAKFSEAGTKVLVSAERDGNGAVTVEVSDEGTGIHPDEQARIFEHFYRAPDTDPATSGTGLGLAIVASYLELLGADIAVDSEVGKGSTFRFTIPAAPPDPSP